MFFKKSPFAYHYQTSVKDKIQDYLVHLGTGSWLAIGKNQLEIWNNFEDLESTRTQMEDQIPESQLNLYLNFLKQLEKVNLILDVNSDILEPLLDLRVHKSLALLWTQNKNGTVSLFLSGSKSKGIKSILLSAIASRIFLLSNGRKTLRNILQTLEIATLGRTQVLDILCKELCGPKIQSLKFLERIQKSLDREHKDKLYSIFKDQKFSKQVQAHKKKHHITQEGHTDLDYFHREETISAFKHFDTVEISFSHAFRSKLNVFSNTSYGGALFNSVQRFQRTDYFKSILEVGGGTGIVAREFLTQLLNSTSQNRIPIEYTICDLSPQFLKSQKKLLKKLDVTTHFIQADAQRARLKKTFSTILCNEVIADFLTVKIKNGFSKNKIRKDPLFTESLNWLKKIDPSAFTLEKAEFHFNLGAIRFLENMFQHLEPTGKLYISEYGSMWDFPSPTTHLNHDEYSIHWPHLVSAARFIGYRSAEIFDLQSFLEIDPSAEVYSGPLDVLVKLFRKLGRDVEMRVYDKSEILDLVKWARNTKNFKIEGVHFEPFLNGKYWGPNIKNFKVLVLQK